ncbi:hypothetical protein [Pigmentiphaga sp.]|jgi:hypothetical protein|uniref:hypothetical protein n=1 Tax=Pigmentiphaga sp. TaxID=1977564 RepID=UPI0025F5C174|nr:hypothetical protein [Pigmentiphaga sp.]MBX6320076.1 hypothetical protein [Pigmentiphaga sp.]
MDIRDPERRAGSLCLRRFFDLLLLAGFSSGFMWVIVKFGAMCPAVLDHFAISSVF